MVVPKARTNEKRGRRPAPSGGDRKEIIGNAPAADPVWEAALGRVSAAEYRTTDEAVSALLGEVCRVLGITPTPELEAFASELIADDESTAEWVRDELVKPPRRRN